MVKFLLQRVSQTGYGSFGVLMDGETYAPLFTTVERPWKDNKPFESCIPGGRYVVKRVVRPKHGECFEVQGVPDRSAILFHVANWPKDVQGCIGLGMGFGGNTVEPIVSHSKNAMDIFMSRLFGKDEFELHIAPEVP